MASQLFLIVLETCFLISTVYGGKILIVNNTIACGPDQPMVVKEGLGYLTSPRYDNFNYYPPNARCSWILQAPEGNVVLLLVKMFSLNVNCDVDAIEIYDGVPPEGSRIGIFCGYWMSSRIKSSGNSLYLRFRTGRTPSGVGFQFFFQHSLPFVECTNGQVTCKHKTKCVDKSKKCDGIDDCGDGTDEEDCDNVPVHTECGMPEIPPLLINERIVGGRDAVPGSWPWQVSLRQIDLNPESHMCGGVLINRKWVLTAAHCFKRKVDIRLWNVLMGKHFKLIPEKTEQVRYVKSVIMHPDYKGIGSTFSTPWLTRKQHDIALMELNAPVTVTDFVTPVCLPAGNRTFVPGSMCYVTGWGETYGTGFERVLKQAAIPVISNEDCQSLYFHRKPIADTMLCAGHSKGGHDSCKGDSGGPLVFLEDHRWILAGVVSSGGEICADENQPGIYTAVPKYVDWISNVTGQEYN